MKALRIQSRIFIGIIFLFSLSTTPAFALFFRMSFSSDRFTVANVATGCEDNNCLNESSIEPSLE